MKKQKIQSKYNFCPVSLSSLSPLMPIIEQYLVLPSQIQAHVARVTKH